MTSVLPDPLARAELETLAQHWRDVYPAGGHTYQVEIMELLASLRRSGAITGDQTSWLFLLIARYANRESDRLDLDAPTPEPGAP